MLTCIACSKQQFAAAGGPPLHESPEDNDVVDGGGGIGGGGAATPSTRHAIKALTAQIKDMALKASGAYRHCKPCAGSSAAASRRHHPYHHRGGSSGFGGSDAGSASDRFHYAYRRAGSSAASTPRLRSGGAALSSGDATPSMSVRTDFPAGDEEENDEMASEAAGGCGGGGKDDDAKEWVAHVEPGVLITFVSLAQGGNDLKRIRFSREMFNKWQAQRWWAENYDKVMELYNVQRFNQTVPLPTTPKSEDESSKEDSPVTPPLDKEPLPRTFHGQGGGAMGYSSSDSLEHHSNHYSTAHHHHHGHQCCDSMGLASTPKLSSISGAKTETSSMDASMRTSSSPEEVDRSGELSVSISNASDQEREWVEEDEPGVYITIRALPGGIRELRRVRFRALPDSTFMNRQVGTECPNSL
ncbi:unnamed protein product [Miscanthus lutarioriparius]|uniref:BRX domain-containing protein n=1 Tax=Miscanthus lutarioriparius TaxID=422564 RepID=A0A811SPM6_9POAL|nr:unnamed protein product [Miscanthus lutarioriparius]